MKIKPNTFFISLNGLLLVLFCLSCTTGRMKKEILPDIGKIENRFFVLDFEKSELDLSNVEKHFFTTFPHDDPTEGDVVYDRQKWINETIIRLKEGDGLYLFIKHRNDDLFFDSVRLTSKTYFNLSDQISRILFVFKGRLPSAEGVWPAWWLNGSYQDSWLYNDSGYIETDQDLDRYSGKGPFYATPSAVNPTDWPAAGEIDIIETINGNNIIHNTIHTCPQMCDSRWNSDGQMINCANAKPDDPNAGCSGKPYKVSATEGTFACLWQADTIRFYYWDPSENVRADGGPLSNHPNPEEWKTTHLKNTVELMDADSECNDGLHGTWQCQACESRNICLFKNMKMIFNITLCGKWAGRQFDSTDNSLANCRAHILGPGKESIHNQFLKIEFISVNSL